MSSSGGSDDVALGVVFGIGVLILAAMLLSLLLVVVVYIAVYAFLFVVLPGLVLAAAAGALWFIWKLAEAAGNLLGWDEQHHRVWQNGSAKSLAIAYALAILWLPANILWLHHYPVDFRTNIKDTADSLKSFATAAKSVPVKMHTAVFDFWEWGSPGGAAKAPKILALPKAGMFAQPLRSIAFRGSTGAFGAWRSHGSHKGLDLVARRGTPVRAAADGKVIIAGWGKGYGRWVNLRHTDGCETRYAHLQRIHAKRGERVKQGQLIGRVGNSGNARGTKPHLHLELRCNGRVLDPGKYIPLRR